MLWSCEASCALNEGGGKGVRKRLSRIVTVDDMQFDFMPESGTIDAVFILRGLQDEYHVKGKKLYMCFVYLEKAFVRVLRKVYSCLAMRKKGISGVMFELVMSLFEGAKMRVSVDSELSEEFEIKVKNHHGSVLSHFLFAVVVDVVTEFVREGALSELLYADNLVLMSETIKDLRDKFLTWKKAFESSDLGKAKVSSGIARDGLSKSKVDPCGSAAYE